MKISASSIGLSAVDTAHTRLANAAHNVANLQTQDFRNRRTQMLEQEGGGVRAVTSIDAEPAAVDLADEAVNMMLAELQAKAAARVVGKQEDLTGYLLDVLA